MACYTGFERMSAEQLKELLDDIAKKGPSEELKILAFILWKYLTMND